MRGTNAMNRREWILTVVGAALATSAISARRRHVTGESRVTVYKDPGCGCCRAWVSHLEANGFAVTAHDRQDMSALKDSLGIPMALRSCHTAVAGTLLIEGHVPAADMHKAMAMRSTPLGLAVPGMPSGSPGMEGAHADKYDVIAFDTKGGTKLFASHG